MLHIFRPIRKLSPTSLESNYTCRTKFAIDYTNSLQKLKKKKNVFQNEVYKLGTISADNKIIAPTNFTHDANV